MISTVTVSSVTTVSALGVSAALGVLAVVALIAFLAAKELLSASPSSRFKLLGRSLNVGIVPLIMVFGVIAITKIVEVLS